MAASFTLFGWPRRRISRPGHGSAYDADIVEACTFSTVEECLVLESRLDLRLLHREDIAATVKMAASAISIRQKTPMLVATATAGTTTTTGHLPCGPHWQGNSRNVEQGEPGAGGQGQDLPASVQLTISDSVYSFPSTG